MKMLIRYFSYSKRGLMSNYFVGFFNHVQTDSSLPSCFLSLMLAKQGKRGSISTGKPWCFCSKPGCDFSHLMLLMLFLLTLTVSLQIRVQQYGNGLYKLTQTLNRNKSWEYQKEGE